MRPQSPKLEPSSKSKKVQTSNVRLRKHTNQAKEKNMGDCMKLRERKCVRNQKRNSRLKDYS